jgi:heme/copper-type cytochrome/quinol oxidase subunit 3
MTSLKFSRVFFFSHFFGTFAMRNFVLGSREIKKEKFKDASLGHYRTFCLNGSNFLATHCFQNIFKNQEPCCPPLPPVAFW